MNEWGLIKVEKTEWQQDASGIFTLIGYRPDGTIRLDVMTDKYEPVISFQGKAENVRKVAMRWVWKNEYSVASKFSLEHASYVGEQLAKADLLKEKYIQD